MFLGVLAIIAISRGRLNQARQDAFDARILPSGAPPLPRNSDMLQWKRQLQPLGSSSLILLGAERDNEREGIIFNQLSHDIIQSVSTIDCNYLQSTT